MSAEWIGTWAGGRIRAGRAGRQVWTIERSIRGKRVSISLDATNEAEALEALRLFQIRNGLPVTAQVAPEPRELLQEAGLIYFVRAGAAVKIGFTANVEKRLAQLRGAAAEGLFLLGLLPGTRETERRLHVQFASLRMHAEWFRAAPELLDFVALTNQELAA